MLTKNKIIIGLLLLVILLTIIGTSLIHKYYTELKKAENNLSIQSEQWKDKEGRLITEVGQMTVNIGNMKDIFRKDSSKMTTEYEKRIYSVKGELDKLGVKYKNLLNFTTGTVTVRDSFIVKFIKNDTTLTAHYTDGYLNQNFTLDTKLNMKSDYTYNDTINVMGIRKPKLKENGKKHWPSWGNLPWVGWDCKSLMYSNNPKASYSGVFSLKTER